jgi:CRISPR type IV-associated protein Csf1
MSKVFSPSEVVVTALGREPDGVPAKHKGVCGYCGRQINPGDMSIPFAAGAAFMDDLSLAARGSAWTCGYCAVLLGAEGLRISGYGMFSIEDGAIPFRKWGDIAKALENPGKPPFVAVYATANNQHMAWRAPVSLSRDVFYVRVGLRDLRIRRPFALRAVEAATRIGEFMGIAPTKSSLSHPFAVLAPDLKDHAHGQLRTSATSKAKGKVLLDEAREALPEEFYYLDNLSLGETWAMRFLLSPNAGQKAETEE